MLDYLPPGINKIIVAPLNWGLGHASRSIVIIKQLIAQGKEVILASDGEALQFLQEEFPELKAIELPSYNVRYTTDSLIGLILNNGYQFISAVVKEHRRAKVLVSQLKPDAIISDSRFGFRSSKVHSIIISHQLNLLAKTRLLKLCMNLVNEFFLNRFNQVWVPDSEERKLSGKLSQNKAIRNVKFIGPLSSALISDEAIQYDIALILSGPEPARTNLENKFIAKLSGSGKRVAFVRGTDLKKKIKAEQNWDIYNRISRKSVSKIIGCSKQIISRAGYSSIMDYYQLGKHALLIPTPGQPEQEYLAEFHSGKAGFRMCIESDISEFEV